MNQQITMNPDLVYQLVASNPNLKNIVEQTARLMQVQQQLGPALQQMATNPMAAVNNYVDWQTQQVQQTQQPQQPQQVQPQQNQQGGQPMGMMEQVMALVDEFRTSFATLNNNLKEVHDMCVANADAIKSLSEKTGDTPLAAKGRVAPTNDKP